MDPGWRKTQPHTCCSLLCCSNKQGCTWDFSVPSLRYVHLPQQCLCWSFFEFCTSECRHTCTWTYQNRVFSYKSIFSRNRYSSFKCKTVEAFPLVCFFFFKHHTLQNWKQNSPDFWIKIQALQPHSKCRLLYFSLRLYHFIEYQNKQRISTPYKVLVLVRRVEGRWTLITLNFFCKSKENSISAKQIWV